MWGTSKRLWTLTLTLTWTNGSGLKTFRMTASTDKLSRLVPTQQLLFAFWRKACGTLSKSYGSCGRSSFHDLNKAGSSKQRIQFTNPYSLRFEQLAYSYRFLIVGFQ